MSEFLAAACSLYSSKIGHASVRHADTADFVSDRWSDVATLLPPNGALSTYFAVLGHPRNVNHWNADSESAILTGQRQYGYVCSSQLCVTLVWCSVSSALVWSGRVRHGVNTYSGGTKRNMTIRQQYLMTHGSWVMLNTRHLSLSWGVGQAWERDHKCHIQSTIYH